MLTALSYHTLISCFQSTPEQKRAAQAELKEAIAELKKSCNDHLAAKVVGTFVDITGPIMELQAAALAPLGNYSKNIKVQRPLQGLKIEFLSVSQFSRPVTD